MRKDCDISSEGAATHLAHLAAFFFVVIISVILSSLSVCLAADVTIAWDANPDPAVTGYRVYFGTATRYYTNAVDAGDQTVVIITDLLPGVTYFFAATDYNDEGFESYFSSEISYTVPGSSSPSESSGGGGCFIATAAFGSYLAPEVMSLRQFRDKYILTSDYGRAFVEWYYQVSPPVAAIIADHESLKVAVRLGLAPVVYSIKYPAAALLLILFIPLAMVVRRRTRWR